MPILESILGDGPHHLWHYFTTATVLVVIIIYNLYFHPLRSFPGPLLQRASRLPLAIQFSSGYHAFRTQRLHDKYGPVVRIGPGHLSFTDPAAWKDIYGHRTFTRAVGSLPTHIINSDGEEHQRFRRALAHGFSDSSMREQEHMIVKYVDLLLQRLDAECDDGKKALNLEAWYNWTTFDIVGTLVFGQSFRCLEDSSYHPWIAFIIKALRLGASLISLNYLNLRFVVQFLAMVGGLFPLRKVIEFTNKMVTARLSMEKGRNDLFEGIVRKRDEWNLSFDKLVSNAFILVLAGSETTATTLSGATFLLTTHRDILDKLAREVRSKFSSPEEITINSVGKLSYMLAVLNESLRLYPPVTSSLVRVVPGKGQNVAGHFIPGGTLVEVQQWSMNHSKDNWADPWVFRPERFLSGAQEAAAQGNRLDALQAFSVGPRNCIGRNLAYAEMRLILARIVFDFDMKLDDDSKRWIERQKAFGLWDRIPLNTYLTPVKRHN